MSKKVLHAPKLNNLSKQLSDSKGLRTLLTFFSKYNRLQTKVNKENPLVATGIRSIPGGLSSLMHLLLSWVTLTVNH